MFLGLIQFLWFGSLPLLLLLPLFGGVCNQESLRWYRLGLRGLKVDKNNIDKEQFAHNTKYSVKAVLNEYPTIKTFEIGIFKFIDYLGDKIYG